MLQHLPWSPGLRAILRLCGMVRRRRAWGLGAGIWEEKAVRRRPLHQMERRLSSQTTQKHSLPSFLGYLGEGGQRYPWRRQVGQALSLSSPSPFLLQYLLNFTCPEVNLSYFRTPGRATNECCRWPGPALARAGGAKLIPQGSGRVELRWCVYVIGGEKEGRLASISAMCHLRSCSTASSVNTGSPWWIVYKPLQEWSICTVCNHSNDVDHSNDASAGSMLDYCDRAPP